MRNSFYKKKRTWHGTAIPWYMSLRVCRLCVPYCSRCFSVCLWGWGNLFVGVGKKTDRQPDSERDNQTGIQRDNRQADTGHYTSRKANLLSLLGVRLNSHRWGSAPIFQKNYGLAEFRAGWAPTHPPPPVCLGGWVGPNKKYQLENVDTGRTIFFT